jgi:hypothetical protein
MKYAVFVRSKEVHYHDGTIASHDDESYLAVVEPEGWVEASSRRMRPDAPTIPKDALTFDTTEKAEAFVKRWKGHPWWCQPNGKYEIVPVEPVFEQVQVGLRRADVPTPSEGG